MFFTFFNSAHVSKRLCRRILSFALAVALIVGSFSVSALAADYAGAGVDLDSRSSASDYSRINTLRAYYELWKSADSLAGDDLLRIAEFFLALKDYSDRHGLSTTLKTIFCVSERAPVLPWPSALPLARYGGHRFGDSSGSRCVYCGLRYDEFVNLLNDSYVGYTQNGDFSVDDPGVVEVQKPSGVQQKEYVTVSDGSFISSDYSYSISSYFQSSSSSPFDFVLYSFPVYRVSSLSSSSQRASELVYSGSSSSSGTFYCSSGVTWPNFSSYYGVFVLSTGSSYTANVIGVVPCFALVGGNLYCACASRSLPGSTSLPSISLVSSSGSFLLADDFVSDWRSSGGSVSRIPILSGFPIETSPYSFGKVNQSLSDSGVIQLRNTSTGSVSDFGQINEVAMQFTLPGRNAPVSVSKWGYFYPDADGNFDDASLSILNGVATGAYKLRLSSPITVSNLPYTAPDHPTTFNATDIMIVYTDSQIVVYYVVASSRDDLGFVYGISNGGFEVYDIILNDDSPLAGDIYNPPTDSLSGLEWLAKPTNYYGSIGSTATFTALASYSGSSDYAVRYAWYAYVDEEPQQLTSYRADPTFSVEVTDENVGTLYQCAVAAFDSEFSMPVDALVSDTVQVIVTGGDAGVLASILGRIERILIDIRQITSDILGRLTGSGGVPGNIDSKDIISNDDSEAAGDGFNLLDLLLSLFKGLWTIVVRLIDFVMGGITSIVDSVTDFGSSLSMFSPSSELNVYDMFAEVA